MTAGGEERAGVLTGAASGIGRHLTGALARAGFRLVATDRDEEALAAAARADRWPAERVLLRPLDVREPDAFRDVIARAQAAFPAARAETERILMDDSKSWQYPVARARGLIVYASILQAMGKNSEAQKYQARLNELSGAS